MLLNIQHVSHYRYENPVPYAVQRLRLRPPTLPGQVVKHWELKIEGGEPEVSYIDGFGNKVDLVQHHRNISEIIITASGSVEVEDRVGVLGPVYGYAPLWLFERETRLTSPGERIRALANSLTTVQDPLALLHEMMNTIHNEVAYMPGTTSVFTNAETALAAGKGVCQDHSHIFVSAARLLGIPARYVSGYLLMEGVEDQTASHAWAEAHVAGLGWIGFDAANNVCPNDRYVRIATGLDYRDAAPISGVRLGGTIESLAVNINVGQ
ncbi:MULTISPECIES: transglutaminase family protein [Ochrobactrum]|uniref:Transglutaminase family protein n=1 Tax=Ochrobactrum chromiisoli TaxID=2993941 RepID=A0ABT3QMC8_9HYPH|nr:transglutaminase family protein [Ochrobactrum chromiisoli]MCX2696773.1 transglutaminase family protein [Ochrobactrum chromiisoli]